MKKKIWLIAGLLGIGSLAFSLTTSFSAAGQSDREENKIQYRHEMVNLLADLRQYTKQQKQSRLRKFIPLKQLRLNYLLQKQLWQLLPRLFSFTVVTATPENMM